MRRGTGHDGNRSAIGSRQLGLSRAQAYMARDGITATMYEGSAPAFRVATGRAVTT